MNFTIALGSLVALTACLIAGTSVHAAMPTLDCEFKTVQKFCEELKAKDATTRAKTPHKFSNGESMPALDSVVGDAVEDYKDGVVTFSKAKKDKLQKIYAEVQILVQDAILRGRKVSKISAEEKNLITRVKTMKLSDLSVAADQATCRDRHRGGYNSETHSMVLCPEMSNYPASGIAWTMGSFIGRGLGTCSVGFVKKTDSKGKLVFDTIPEEKHPFNSLRSCLIQGGYVDSVKTIDFKNPEIAKIIDADPTHSQSNIVSRRECLPRITGSRVDSGIQDWLGSEVAARYISKHPLKAKTSEDQMQPISRIIDYLCRTERNVAQLEKRFQAPALVRFDIGAFSNERLRKAMNCNPKVPAKRICSFEATASTAH